MAYELEGTIKVIMDIHTSPSGFTKREFVVTVGADRYPQDIKLEFVKDKVALLERYQAGQRVKVEFDIRGNEHNGRYYVSLSAWRINPSEGGGADPSAGGERQAERPPFRDSGGAPPRGGGGGGGGDRKAGGGFDRKGGGGFDRKGGGGRGGYDEYSGGGGGGGGRRNRGGGEDDDIDF